MNIRKKKKMTDVLAKAKESIYQDITEFEDKLLTDYNITNFHKKQGEILWTLIHIIEELIEEAHKN